MAPPHCFRAGQSLVDRVSPEVLICLHPVPVMGTLELYVSHHPSPPCSVFHPAPSLKRLCWLSASCLRKLLVATHMGNLHSLLTIDWFSHRLNFESWVLPSFFIWWSMETNILSLWQWLTVACSNCVPNSFNLYHELSTVLYQWKTGLEAVFLLLLRRQVFPSVLCVDSGSQHIECECIFHDIAWGVRERGGHWNGANLCCSTQRHGSIVTKETCV